MKQSKVKQIFIQGYDSTEIINVETGFISRKRNGVAFVPGSNSWVCTGCVDRWNRPALTLAQLYDALKSESKHTLFTKKGFAKFYIADVDHGTARVWGNPRIKSFNIWAV